MNHKKNQRFLENIWLKNWTLEYPFIRMIDQIMTCFCMNLKTFLLSIRSIMSSLINLAWNPGLKMRHNCQQFRSWSPLTKQVFDISIGISHSVPFYWSLCKKLYCWSREGGHFHFYDFRIYFLLFFQPVAPPSLPS